MSDADTFFATLGRELTAFFQPLSDAAADPNGVSILFSQMGWDVTALPQFPTQSVASALAASASAVALIESAAAASPPRLDDVLAAAGKVWDAVNAFAAAAAAPGALPQALGELVADLSALLVTRYAETRARVLYRLFVLLTIITPEEDLTLPDPVIDPTTGQVLRVGFVRPQVEISRLRALLANPSNALLTYYAPQGLPSRPTTDRVADMLLGRVALLLQAVGAPATYGLDSIPDAAAFSGDQLASLAHMLLFGAYEGQTAIGGVRAGVAVGLDGADSAGLGVVVAPTGLISKSGAVGRWVFTISAVGKISALAISGSGVQMLPLEQAAASIAASAATDSAIPIGDPGGTHIMLTHVSLSGSAGVTAAGRGSLSGGVSAKGSILVSAGDSGSLVSQFVPAAGAGIPIDIAASWSNTGGLQLGDGAGLKHTWTVAVSLGPIFFKSFTIELGTTDQELDIVAGTSFLIRLGPVTANVGDVGLRMRVPWQAQRPNVGPLEVHPDLQPPNAIGLVIDAGAVTGGGFLFFDQSRQEYGGVLELEVEGAFSVKVIAVLSTQGGFSLIGLIFVDGFTPIAIGFGFTLNGVGGMLAINRTAAVDVLRAGLKSHRLDSLLFPPDPVANARQIITDLDAAFPRADGRYLFGPMAEIGWGEPTLVTIKLAVLLELPAPVRLIILGQLEALLPDPDAPVVKLHMDAIGVIDFDRGDVALDAVLYDSQVVDFTLTGAMALRASWGANRTLVLAIGGTHPAFQPPPGFPTLDRVAIALAASDNPRLRLDAYLAVTSNTVQFGAHLDLHASTGGFALDGHLGFDTLIHFDPFAFLAELAADLALSHNGAVIMSVGLDMTLSGPSPWHARGKATFHFLLLQASVSFDATFGPAIPPAPVTVPPVEQKLLAALAEPRNWSSVLPASAHPPVRLRPVTPQAQEVLAHPLGQLTVHQREVPLDLAISRFGTVPLASPLMFHIDPSSVQMGGQAANPAAAAVSDYFAPGQFRNLTDGERLSRPSFESYTSGLQFGLASHVAAYPTASGMGYATVVVDPMVPAPLALAAAAQAPDYEVPDAAFGTQVPSGAAARAPLNGIGRAKFAAPRAAVDVTPTTYTIAGTDDLKPPGDTAVFGTFSQTADALEQLLAQHPQQRGRVQLVARQEHRRRDLPPLTTLLIGTPSAPGDGRAWVARATPITLGGAAGVSLRSLSFRIRTSDAPPFTTPNATTASVPLPAAEGTYSVDYFGIDTADNEEDRQTAVIALDATPPQSALVLRPQVPNVGVPAIVSAVDSGAGVASVSYRFYVQGSTTVPAYTTVPGVTAGFTVSGPDGTYQVDHFAADRVGNVEPVRSRLLALDDTPPQSTLVVGAPGYPLDTPAFVTGASRLTVTATDDGSGVRSVSYRVFPQGGAAPPYVTTPGSRVSFALSGADGIHEIDYFATDNVGNIEAAHVATLTLDSTPPQSSLGVGTPSFPSANPGFVTAATPLTISAVDAGAGVSSVSYRVYQRGGAPPAFTAVQGSSATVRLADADGIYQLDMFATDNLGNAEAQHSVVLALDCTPPAISIRQPAASTYASNSTLTLDYSADDGAGAGVESVTATMDGAATLAGHGLASGQAIAVGAELSQGQHTFAVTSLDNLGNTSSASVQFTVGS